MMLFPTGIPPDPDTIRETAEAQPLERLLAQVLAYKGMFAAAAAVGLMLTGLGLCYIQPKYDAQAVLILDSRRNKVADAESALSSIVIDQYQSSIRSELEILLSPDLARQVIVSLDLLHTPEYESALTHRSTASHFAEWRLRIAGGAGKLFGAATLEAERAPASQPTLPSGGAVMVNAVKIFQKAFWAENAAKSLTIRLGYRSTSPELAASITNEALTRYLAADEETKAAALDRTQEWLRNRIAGLREDVAVAEQAVEDFRASNNLSTMRDRSPLQQQLLQLTSQEVDAGAELAAARAKSAQSRTGRGDASSSSSSVLSSRLIQSLRVQEATLVAQQAQSAVGRGTNNPDFIKVVDQLATVRGMIRVELDRIALSSGSDLQIAQAKVATISAKIVEIRDTINKANAADIKLRSLEANATAKRDVLATFMQRYDQSGGTPLTPPDSRVVAWASVPVDSSSPQYGLTLVAGALASVGAAFGLSLLLERQQRGFRGEQELEEELGLLVAGITPQLPRRAIRRGLLSDESEAASISEVALTVRALAHAPGITPTRVVLVTSAVAGEGKSTVALAIARSIANGEQRCLLIDADIRKPSLHGMLETSAMPGLVELTLDQATLASVTRIIEGERFHLIPAGRPTRDLLSPFTASGFGRALAELKRHYDVIVIDSPPVLLASEGLVLSGCADLTLLVVQWRKTTRTLARKAAVLLSRCSAGPRVAILSQVDIKRLRDKDGQLMAEHYRSAYKSASSVKSNAS